MWRLTSRRYPYRRCQNCQHCRRCRHRHRTRRANHVLTMPCCGLIPNLRHLRCCRRCRRRLFRRSACSSRRLSAYSLCRRRRRRHHHRRRRRRRRWHRAPRRRRRRLHQLHRRRRYIESRNASEDRHRRTNRRPLRFPPRLRSPQASHCPERRAPPSTNRLRRFHLYRRRCRPL